MAIHFCASATEPFDAPERPEGATTSDCCAGGWRASATLFADADAAPLPAAFAPGSAAARDADALADACFSLDDFLDLAAFSPAADLVLLGPGFPDALSALTGAAGCPPPDARLVELEFQLQQARKEIEHLKAAPLSDGNTAASNGRKRSRCRGDVGGAAKTRRGGGAPVPLAPLQPAAGAQLARSGTPTPIFAPVPEALECTPAPAVPAKCSNRSRSVKLRGPASPSEGLRSAVARFLRSCNSGPAQQQFFSGACGRGAAPPLAAAPQPVLTPLPPAAHHHAPLDVYACRAHLGMPARTTRSSAAAAGLSCGVSGSIGRPVAVGTFTAMMTDDAGRFDSQQRDEFAAAGCHVGGGDAAASAWPMLLHVEDEAEWQLRDALLRALGGGAEHGVACA